MNYFILLPSEVQQFTLSVPKSSMLIQPILLADGSYALPEAVAPFVPTIAQKQKTAPLSIPFIVDLTPDPVNTAPQIGKAG